MKNNIGRNTAGYKFETVERVKGNMSMSIIRVSKAGVVVFVGPRKNWKNFPK